MTSASSISGEVIQASPGQAGLMKAGQERADILGLNNEAATALAEVVEAATPVQEQEAASASAAAAGTVLNDALASAEMQALRAQDTLPEQKSAPPATAVVVEPALGQVITAPLATPDSEVTPQVKTERLKQPFLLTFWQFSRPHTIYGTALSVPGTVLFAAPALAAMATRQAAAAVLYALFPSLLVNVYITGLNQITDVDIDKVNKPYLPMAAGHLSMRGAIATVTGCLATALAIGFAPVALASGPLKFTLLASAFIGTVYSLPPFRLKRFPLLAAICILGVRGSIINAGFYAHGQQAAYGLMEGSSALSLLRLPITDLKCGLLSAYFALFGTVIALTKDIPDIDGDAKFGIRSFSVRVGQGTMFKVVTRMMAAVMWAFSAALAAAAHRSLASSIGIVGLARAGMAVIGMAAGQAVMVKARSVDPSDSGGVFKYYMFLWKIFYASYICLPWIG
ncbi:unnamed protein product [Chrysoparadoxa australica]